MIAKIINNFVKCPECEIYYSLEGTGKEEKGIIEKKGMCQTCLVIKERKRGKKYKIKFLKCPLCRNEYQDERNRIYIKDFKSCRKCKMDSLK